MVVSLDKVALSAAAFLGYSSAVLFVGYHFGQKAVKAVQQELVKIEVEIYAKEAALRTDLFKIVDRLKTLL